MTTTLTPPTTSTTLPAPIRNTFAGVLKSEFIKLWSLRSMRVTLILAVLVAAGISTLGAIAMRSILPLEALASDPQVQLEYLSTIMQPPVMFQALLFGILGVFAVSSEYSSGMILSTLAATPKRGRLLTAKLVAVSVISVLAALVTLLLGVGIAVALTPEAISVIMTEEILTSAAGIMIFLLSMTLLAFGVAAILRSTAGGIAVVAGLTFVLPIAFSFASMANKAWIDWIMVHLPLNVGSAAAAGLPDSVVPGALSWGESLVTAGVWAVLFLIPAVIMFLRRDAK